MFAHRSAPADPDAIPINKMTFAHMRSTTKRQLSDLPSPSLPPLMRDLYRFQPREDFLNLRLLRSAILFFFLRFPDHCGTVKLHLVVRGLNETVQHRNETYQRSEHQLKPLSQCRLGARQLVICIWARRSRGQFASDSEFHSANPPV